MRLTLDLVEQCSIACPSPSDPRSTAPRPAPDDRRRQLLGHRPGQARRDADPGPLDRRGRRRGRHLARPAVPLLPDQARLLPRLHRGRRTADPAQHRPDETPPPGRPGRRDGAADGRADRPAPRASTSRWCTAPGPPTSPWSRCTTRIWDGGHGPGGRGARPPRRDPGVVHAWWAYVEDHALSWSGDPRDAVPRPRPSWSRTAPRPRRPARHVLSRSGCPSATIGPSRASPRRAAAGLPLTLTACGGGDDDAAAKAISDSIMKRAERAAPRTSSRWSARRPTASVRASSTRSASTSSGVRLPHRGPEGRR